MTVEHQCYDHIPFDDEISVSLKKLGTSHLAQSSSTLIQSSYQRFHDLSHFTEIRQAALTVQCAARMYKSRTNTIKFVRDGQDSPLVTLRGKYLCGQFQVEPSGPPTIAVDEKTEILVRVTPIDGMNPRRTGRKPKVARLFPDSQSDKDPLLDPSGLPATAHQLNRLTLDNTKRNSLYKMVTIKVEEVPVGQPRPGSPKRAWSKKPMHKKTELEDEESQDLSLRWNKKLVFLDDLTPKAPLDSSEICIPIKPILRRPRTPNLDSLHPIEPAEILVKKIVYADEVEPDYGVEDIMQDCGGHAPTKKGRRKTSAVDKPSDKVVNSGKKANAGKPKRKQKSSYLKYV